MARHKRAYHSPCLSISTTRLSTSLVQQKTLKLIAEISDTASIALVIETVGLQTVQRTAAEDEQMFPYICTIHNLLS